MSETERNSSDGGQERHDDYEFVAPGHPNESNFSLGDSEPQSQSHSGTRPSRQGLRGRTVSFFSDAGKKAGSLTAKAKQGAGAALRRRHTQGDVYTGYSDELSQEAGEGSYVALPVPRETANSQDQGTDGWVGVERNVDVDVDAGKGRGESADEEPRGSVEELGERFDLFTNDRTGRPSASGYESAPGTGPGFGSLVGQPKLDEAEVHGLMVAGQHGQNKTGWYLEPSLPDWDDEPDSR